MIKIMSKKKKEKKEGKIKNHEEYKGVKERRKDGMETLSSCTTSWKMEKSLVVHASCPLPFPSVPLTSFSRLPYTKRFEFFTLLLFAKISYA